MPVYDLRLPLTSLVLAALTLLAGGCARTPGQLTTDDRFRPVYEAEWRWRKEQSSGSEDRSEPVPATQQQRREYWEETLHTIERGK